MRTVSLVLLALIVALPACAPAECEPAEDFGFPCAGVDEYESEELALRCAELGGTCAAADGAPSYCVPE